MTVQEVALNLTAHTPEACSKVSLPFASTLPPGGSVDVPLFNGTLPAATPTGTYTLFFDVLGPGAQKLGAGDSILRISPRQASTTDGVVDCRDRTTGAPAPAEACAGAFDVKEFFGLTDPASGTYYGRIKFRSGPVEDVLAPGEDSKSWNWVVLGGGCNFAGIVANLRYVIQIEEQTFAQPKSPMTSRALECQNGILVQNVRGSFSVGSDFVEMWGPLPAGIPFAGQQGVVVIGGKLQGQPRVFDTTPTFTQ